MAITSWAATTDCLANKGSDTLSGSARMDALDDSLCSDVLSVGLGIDTSIFAKSGSLTPNGQTRGISHGWSHT